MPAKAEQPDYSKLIGIAILVFVAWKAGWLGGIVGPSAGPRIVKVVHETAQDTPQISSELLKIRTGTHADYLKSKQHTLDIVDRDKDDPLVQKFKPYSGAEVLVIQSPDKLVGRAPFTTADAAIEFLKKNGG